MSTAAQHSKAVTNSPTQAIDVLVDAPPAIPECQHKSSTTDSPDQSPPALALVIRRCHTDSTQSFVLRSETPVHHMYLVPWPSTYLSIHGRGPPTNDLSPDPPTQNHCSQHPEHLPDVVHGSITNWVEWHFLAPAKVKLQTSHITEWPTRISSQLSFVSPTQTTTRGFHIFVQLKLCDRIIIWPTCEFCPLNSRPTQSLWVLRPFVPPLQRLSPHKCPSHNVELSAMVPTAFKSFIKSTPPWLIRNFTKLTSPWTLVMSPDCLAFCYFSLVSTLASCTTVCANHQFSRTFASKTLIRDQSHQPSSSLLTPRPLSPQLANLPARRNRHTSVCHWHRTQPDQTANLHWESALPQQCSRLGLHCPFRTPVLRPSQQLNSEINPPAFQSSPPLSVSSTSALPQPSLEYSDAAFALPQELHLPQPSSWVSRDLQVPFLGPPATNWSILSVYPGASHPTLFFYSNQVAGGLQTPSLLGLTKGLRINICPLQAFTRSPC